MLKNIKTKLTAAFAFVALLATLISPIGVFADVPISNADDYFSNLPTLDSKLSVSTTVEALNNGIGKIDNSANTTWAIGVKSSKNSLKFTSNYTQNQNRSHGLYLNFGMYDGANEVTTYYGTNALYSYAMDLNINFADTSSLSAGAGISNVDGSSSDSRAHFILQGFGSPAVYLYQNGWKLDNQKGGSFSSNFADGKYTAVYTINMGSDITTSKGSWKLLKKDDSGNVTDTIYLSQNIALAASVDKGSWTAYYNNYGIYVGLDTPYNGSSIEITGARFYRETLNGDTNAAFAKLPTQSNKSAANLNSAIGMPGMIEAAIVNGNVSSTANKLTVKAPYGTTWVGADHRNHNNGYNFTHDVKEISEADPGVYIYETDLILHNLGAVEDWDVTKDGVVTEHKYYPSTVIGYNASEAIAKEKEWTYIGVGNRMRIVSGGACINIYADGLADNDSGSFGKLKQTLKGESVPLKVVQVLKVESKDKATYDIYAKNGDGDLEYMYSKTLLSSDTSKGAIKLEENIGSVGVYMNACSSDDTYMPSLDILRQQFHKVDVTDLLTFKSASYEEATDKVTVTAAYDYSGTADKSGVLVAAIYDGTTGALLGVGTGALSITAADYIEGTKSVSVDVSYSGDMTGKSVKLYTWNSLDGMKPMFDAKPVSAQ